MIRRLRLTPTLLCLVLLLTASSARASRDISFAGFSPAGNTRVYLNVPTSVVVTIKNTGTETADTVGIRVVMVDLGGIFYDDSVTVYAIPANTTMQIALEDVLRTVSGPFETTITLSLTGDEQPGDNSVTIDNQAMYHDHDIIARSVVDPVDGGSKPQKLGFRPSGSFMSYWSPETSVPVRVQIRRCADNGLVYQADTTIGSVPGKSTPITQIFPAAQNGWDTRSLRTGCYRMAIIARKSNDGDRTNDTAYSNFTVTPHKLAYDVAVDTATSIPYAPLAHGSEVPIKLSYTNVGTVDVSNVKLYVTIEKNDDEVIYRDSSVVTAWPAGLTVSRTFKTFSTDEQSTFRLTTFTVLSNDQDHYDDTLHRLIRIFDQSQFEVVEVKAPAAGQLILGGTSFQPMARFRWTGNVSVAAPNARIVISGRDFIYTSTFTTPLTGLDFDTPERDLSFPSIDDDNRPTASLPKGRYHATATVEGSNASPRVNEFEIAYTHDARVVTMESPLARSYSDSPMNVRYLVHNAGLSHEGNVGFTIDIFDRNDSLVYSSSKDMSLQRGEYALLTFDDFQPHAKGFYRAVPRIYLPVDGDSSDNSLSYYFHFGPSTQDPALVATVSPSPNQVLHTGDMFDLKVIADWLGEYAATRFCTVDVSIRDCGSDQEVYAASNFVAIDGITTVTLPSSRGGRSVAEIPAGCYKAFFSIVREEDLDTTDNHLEVPFTIEQTAGVDHGSTDTRSMIAELQRNGSNLMVKLNSALNGSWRLMNVAGVELYSGSFNNDAFNITLTGLASGLYFLEVMDSVGSAHQVKAVSVVN